VCFLHVSLTFVVKQRSRESRVMYRMTGRIVSVYDPQKPKESKMNPDDGGYSPTSPQLLEYRSYENRCFSCSISKCSRGHACPAVVPPWTHEQSPVSKSVSHALCAEVFSDCTRMWPGDDRSAYLIRSLGVFVVLSGFESIVVD